MIRPALLLLLTACGTATEGTSTDTSDTETGSGDTADTGSGDTADTSKDTANDTADTGNDTADTGTDTGKDTADSGTDTGDTSVPPDTGDTSVPPDTGDTSVPPDTGDTGTSTGCTKADLILSGEVRDAAGVAGTSFGPKDALTMVAIVTNLCPMDVTFTTPWTCLFTGWNVTSSSGMGSGMAVACAGVVTSWTVPAGGTLEEGQAWGRLAVDSYVLDVTADIPAATATTSFSVI